MHFKRRTVGILFLMLWVILPGVAQERYGNLEGAWKAINGKRIVFPSDFDKMPALFLFLSPECPLCINYIPVLSALYERYKGQVKVYGIFSGSYYKPRTIKRYAKKYQLEFPLLIDSEFILAGKLHAEITPECVLLDQHGIIRYSGAIDDRAPALGIFKNKPSVNYLEAAVESLLAGNPIQTKFVKANGCFIYP